MTMSDHTLTSATPTRRQLLRTGALGAAAAAFLASCSGGDDGTAGMSGTPGTEASVPPTVPPYTPKESDLANNQMLLRTSTSLELFAAMVYEEYGPKLTNEEWKTHAARFAVDHAAAADVFAEATDPAERIDEPNEWMITNSLEPVEPDLIDDSAILTYLQGVESSLTATYIATVGQWVDEDDQDEWRFNYAAYASAAARRDALLGNDGEGKAPTSALYPPTNLIPGEAYMVTPPSEAEEASIEEEDEAIEEAPDE